MFRKEVQARGKAKEEQFLKGRDEGGRQEGKGKGQEQEHLFLKKISCVVPALNNKT